jgi:hypothetical protein
VREFFSRGARSLTFRAMQNPEMAGLLQEAYELAMRGKPIPLLLRAKIVFKGGLRLSSLTPLELLRESNRFAEQQLQEVNKASEEDLRNASAKALESVEQSLTQAHEMLRSADETIIKSAIDRISVRSEEAALAAVERELADAQEGGASAAASSGSDGKPGSDAHKS